MSATMYALTTWRERNGLRPLREIAAEQGARLRALQDGVPTTRKSRLSAERHAAVVERCQRAMASTPATAVRHTPAPVVYATPPADRRAEMTALDAMAAALPLGRYALPRRAEAGAGQSVYFFQVEPFRGGQRIVMLTGGVGAFQRHPMSLPYQRRALEQIARDPRAAAVRFGHETSTCARCGSPLTNDKSRARGLGPDCAKHY